MVLEESKIQGAELHAQLLRSPAYQAHLRTSRELLDRLGLLPPERVDLSRLPRRSFYLRIDFKLETPYMSRDDRAFSITENPVRKDRVFELCEEIIKRKIKFRWDVRAHVNTIEPDLLKVMAAAGCDRIHYGVESGNDRMLKEIKKNSTVARIVRKHGGRVWGEGDTDKGATFYFTISVARVKEPGGVAGKDLMRQAG